MEPRGGTPAFQPGSGQRSGDTCTMWGSHHGSIGEPPRSEKWPGRTGSGGPQTRRILHSEDPAPRTPGCIREGSECYPSRPWTHEIFPLAHFEPVTLVTTPDVEQPKVLDSTPKLLDVIATAKHNLSDAESWELEELLTEYGDIFDMDSDDYGRTERVYHSIDMGGGPGQFANLRGDSPWRNRRMCARC
jgi:hypothetical protein